MDTTQEGAPRRRIGWQIVTLVLVFFLFLAACPVFSFSASEVEMRAGGMPFDVLNRHNFLGIVGCKGAWFFLFTFGLALYPGLLLVAVSALRRLMAWNKVRETSFEYFVAFPLFTFGMAMFLGIWPGAFSELTQVLNLQKMPGGVIGLTLCSPSGILTYLMNGTGAALLSGVLIAVSLAVIWFFDWRGCFQAFLSPKTEPNSFDAHAEALDAPAADVAEKAGAFLSKNIPEESQGTSLVQSAEKAAAHQQEPMRLKTHPKVEKQQSILFPIEKPHGNLPLPEECNAENYRLPSPELLESNNVEEHIGASEQEIRTTAATLQETLDVFKVDAKVVGVVSGPQVTMYKILPKSGVRLNRITKLEDNIKMALSAISLRILAPIPGEAKVGIEVPNRKASTVSVCGLMEDPAWTGQKYRIPILLGRDVNGHSILIDLAKAPHLLIAGTTGSGKSVCMNLIILSLLYRFRPDELRLIMVDPKVVEFQAYEKIPHLVVPVINEAAKVPLALGWAIREMERRYRIMAKVQARDLDNFNHRTIDPTAAPVLDEDGVPIPARMPYIVIFIDELADIMLMAKKEMDKCVAALAAKARAVGIHLVIATQRPDVSVVTGTIKANFPSRIALKVSSQVDSQTIIGGKGAEGLLGNGDMLLKTSSSMELSRVQCGWVSDQDRLNSINYIVSQAAQKFDDTVLQEPAETTASGAGSAHSADGSDENYSDDERLLREAVEVILRDRRPTISYLQRQLGIGYNKAATLIEKMEQRGILGKAQGSAPREILINSVDEIPDGDEGV